MLVYTWSLQPCILVPLVWESILQTTNNCEWKQNHQTFDLQSVLPENMVKQWCYITCGSSKCMIHINHTPREENCTHQCLSDQEPKIR